MVPLLENEGSIERFLRQLREKNLSLEEKLRLLPKLKGLSLEEMSTLIPVLLEIDNTREERLTNLQAKLRQLKVVADSLDEARKLIRAQMPPGLEVLSEEEIADGKPKTIMATGKTLEEALSKGRTQVPKGAQIVRETELTRPGQRIINVEAFDKKEAEEKAERVAKPGEKVQQCRQVKPGRSGFLGLGRKPSRYEISLFQVATVELVAKGKASVRATFGEKHLVDEIIRLRSRALDLAWFKSGAPESRAGSSPIKSGAPESRASSPISDYRRYK
jgi:hypothetical protein